ncbi:MAG: hypothetical protein JWO79_1494 [Actinomycetia bacterium]|nr:hypothetical protein [Actinomycetes bacterium]MDQ1651340.1 uncharacterized protein [Cryptosporangiaceae bacterium]MDQ1654994.1 uncharacterized protein [Cryptosporangiaceae bacterium]
MLDSNGLEVLSRAECLALLAVSPIGRVVFSHQAMPAIEPVNFVLDGEDIVIRTNPGAKLAAATKNAVVALEIDDIDIDEHTGWSVTVVGRAEAVADPGELDRLGRLPLRPWVPGEHPHFIRIPVEVVSGRRLSHLTRGPAARHRGELTGPSPLPTVVA